MSDGLRDSVEMHSYSVHMPKKPTMETKLKQEPVADGTILCSSCKETKESHHPFSSKCPRFEPVADGGGGMPELPATTDPFETLRNTARWCMAASQQDWEDDLIDIKTAASGAPKTILALFAQLASSQEALRVAREIIGEYRGLHMSSRRPCVDSATCSTCQEAIKLLSPEGSSR